MLYLADMVFLALKVFIFCFLVTPSIGWGGEKKSPLQEVKKRYQAAELIKMHFTKEVSTEFGLNKKDSGVFIGHFKKDTVLFRFEVPKKSLLLFDGNYLWALTHPPENMKTPPQVIKSSEKKFRKFKNLWSSLLGYKKIEDEFKILKTSGNNAASTPTLKHSKEKQPKEKQKVVKYFLEPKKQADFFKKIDLEINPSTKTLEALSFEDELGSKTRYDFKNLELKSHFDKNLFKFKVPEGATVESI